MRRCGVFKNLILKAINSIVCTRSNEVFAYPIPNCRKDRYDILNYESDTVLSFINYWMKNEKERRIKINLVIFHPDRISLYKEYVSEFSNYEFNFIADSRCYRGIRKTKSQISIMLARFRSALWLIEMIPSIRSYALDNQFQLCLTYFSSCKSDYDFKSDFNYFLKSFNLKKNVVVLSTSVLDSAIKSAAYGVPYSCFKRYGLTRNDNLNSHRTNDKLKEYIRNIFEKYSRIILYAPTFRDYENVPKGHTRNLWGKEYDNKKINEYLKARGYLVIAKIHSWQNESVIEKIDGNIVKYEPRFDFSYYELMQYADLMITDYSSIGLDWLLLDKPIIYNLYDIDEYRVKRGLGYEPYEEFCGGYIARNSDELIEFIDMALKNKEISDKQKRVKNIIFENQSFNTCEKVLSVIDEWMNDGKVKNN